MDAAYAGVCLMCGRTIGYAVHGTFFTVGSNIVRYPDVVRQVVDSGSEVGLHTFTHADLTTVSSERLVEEMSQSQVALAGATGVTTELIRPPYSSSPAALDDDDYAVVEALGDRGYLTVLSDVDSKDWETTLSVEQMLANATPADGAGGTILFHDAGGDRSKTVAVLEQLVPRLQAEGYTFTTVGDAVGLTATTVPADTAEQLRGKVVLAAVAVSTGFVRLLSWLLVGVGLLVVARLVLMVAVARRHRRRRDDPRFSWGPPVTEPVSVVVPAYNERAGIADTLASLLASDHPIEIVVVDDGSTDGTADIAEAVPDPRVRVIRQRNAGKAAALNTGIAYARHALVVMMDGDTVFEPNTVRRLCSPSPTRASARSPATPRLSTGAAWWPAGSTWSTWSALPSTAGCTTRSTACRRSRARSAPSAASRWSRSVGSATTPWPRTPTSRSPSAGRAGTSYTSRGRAAGPRRRPGSGSCGCSATAGATGRCSRCGSTAGRCSTAARRAGWVDGDC